KKKKKSTVLKCIYGILLKWNKDAQVFFNGKDITNRPTSEMVKQGIVYIPQKDNYFESLTVHENLVVSGSAYTGDVVKQRINEVYQLPHLKEYSNRTPFNLSGGERQLLALGNALMHKPKLILFDEPFAGLDDANTKIIVDELLKLKEQKIGMLIVEHKLIFDKFADKVLKMELGKIFNENKLF
ncbi:MAG: ATP-binding cassette domain-containing protein, partial [Bacteroidia bacterium]|nr:ATP-binding cassette domain-containing protein [Bacteroidia bacterium]